MNHFSKLIAVAFLFASGPAVAATLATLPSPSAGHDLVTWNSWKGQSFVLSTTATSCVVISATLSLEVVVPNANMVVRVVGSTGTPGQPNMSDIRAELRPMAWPTGTAVVPLTFTSDPAKTFPALEADAVYWLVAGMTSEDVEQTSPAGLVRWHYAGAHGQTPGAEPGWAVGTKVASSNTAGDEWYPVTETPFLFSVTAIPIPEPSTLAFCLAPVILVMRRRRSNRPSDLVHSIL
jgi:hypothetical protein